MPHVKRFVQAVALSALAAGTAGYSAGCQEAAAAATAAQASKAALNVLASLPEWVQQQVRALEKKNNLTWGQPDKIIVLDMMYVITYPTPEAELKKNNGKPRMIVISRLNEPQHL